MKSIFKLRWFFLPSLVVAATVLFGFAYFPPRTASARIESDKASAEIVPPASLRPLPTLFTPASGPSAMAATKNSPTSRPTPTPATRSGQGLASSPTASSFPTLSEFSRRVANGNPGALCGLYVAGVTALRIVQQPKGDAGFISTEAETATQFQKANPFGAVGLLAHNTLAGQDFFSVHLGQDLVLVYGDGRDEHFGVSEIVDYQRLTRADLRSNFLQLDTHQQSTADQVFARFYQHAHRLTLQTCLKRGEMADWGVHFIMATPSLPPH